MIGERMLGSSGGKEMRKKHTSLGAMLTHAFLVFSALLLVLMLFMDWYLISGYQMAKREQEHQALAEAADRVHSDMLRINYTLYDISENNTDFKALSGKLTDLEQFSHSYDLNEALKVRLLLEDYLHGHFLFYDNWQSTRYFVHQDFVDSQDVYELRVLIKEHLKESGTGRKWHYATANGSSYGLLPLKRGNTALCLIYNLSRLEEVLLESVPESCELFFVETGECFGKPEEDPELLESLKAASSKYSRWHGNMHISACRIGNTNLWLCMRVPVNLFFYMSPGQLILLLVTVLMVLGLIMLRRQMKDYLMVPLQRLVHTMNRIRDGEWEAKVESADFEEIQKVNDALETMVEEIYKQKILAYEQRIEKQQTQMRFLQLQLKPHFYLNGLKTLNALVMEEDWRSTQDMIISLSDHMRYLLHSERELVPLEAEVNFIQNYTQLQKNMTGRPFRVVWDIKNTHRRWNVPVLCIQTFLENSFKYAKMGNAQKELLLRVSVRELETEEGAYLDICVRDNGCGYPESVLDNINEDPFMSGLGVGIKNLQRRCELLYGGAAQYNFYNDNGAVSELSLPWREGGAE